MAMNHLNFDNSFARLPSFLREAVLPTPIREPRLIHVTNLRKDLGLDHLSDPELMNWLNGETSLPGDQRLSSRYAGHQFGVWAGQLGDGRAISLGEILTQTGRLEIQTKGSGLTPFSRMGDGKAVIRSSVREYLCSEAMYVLGIPTTRVLALITGKDDVYRESIERSAIVARVFPSNLRFGHFEMCFHFDKKDELKALIEYTQNTFFDGMTVEEMLQEITKRTAVLMGRWMGVGFCHGVMNTDNMSVLGLTIDYGPFGFLEDTDLNHICNHSDHQGRYAFQSQPYIGMWNLERFLICFINELPREKLESILNSYQMHFKNSFIEVARSKLGLLENQAGDGDFFSELLKLASELSLDFTYLFRELSRYEARQPESLKTIWDYYGKRPELLEWLGRYDQRLGLEKRSQEERHMMMLKTNPKYVLRNYIAQEVIEDVEADSSSKLKAWLEVLYHPFDEHPGFEAYALPTPPEKKNYVVSCSS